MTETLEFDGGRKITVYIPLTPPENIVFAGDGQRIAEWGLGLERAMAPPTMVVGVHSLTDGTMHLHEYSLGFDPNGSLHMKCFPSKMYAMGELAPRRGGACGTYRDLRRIGGRRTGTRPGALTSASLRIHPLRFSWRRLQAARYDAISISSHLSRRRHARTFLPRQR